MKEKLLKIWNSKWNPFGNYDDPIPPQRYLDKYGWFAWIYWYFVRNPLHNFDHYWIGTGNYPSEWNTYHSQRSWNLILPLFSFRCKWFRFYIGWRPKKDGSQIFGIRIKFTFKQNE